MFSVDENPLYNFDTMEKNNLTDPKSIHKILMDKYAKRTIDMELRNALLDEEGQAFHKSLPHMYDFENIKNTRSYQDDFHL